MNQQRQDLKVRTKRSARRIIGNQVLRSGTSVGANYREASRARSEAEFIAKIGDCLKEIAETEYWLELLVEGDLIPEERMTPLLQGTRELIAIFTSIDKNAKSSRAAGAKAKKNSHPSPLLH
jgi:four helix bundle protein